MKAFITRIFGTVETRYLIRAYLIGLAFLCSMLWVNLSHGNAEFTSDKVVLFTLFIISTLLFPFAKLVWDELRDTVMGNTVLSFHGWMMFAYFVFKILVNAILWSFAIIVAPFGVLYLWLRSSKPQ